MAKNWFIGTNGKRPLGLGLLCFLSFQPLIFHLFFVSSEEHQLHHPPLPLIFYSQSVFSPYPHFASYCEYRSSTLALYLKYGGASPSGHLYMY